MGPALLFSPAHGVRPSAMIKDRVVDPARAPGRGCHQRDGILIVGGAHAVHGDLGRCSIYDLTPTMLWVMAAGIPSDGDGRSALRGVRRAPCRVEPVHEVDGGWVEADGRDSGYSDEVARRLKASWLHLDDRDTDARRRARRLLVERARSPAVETRRAPESGGVAVDRGQRRAREHDPLLHRPCLGLVRYGVLAGGTRHLRLHDASRGRRLERRDGVADLRRVTYYELLRARASGRC